MLTTEGTENTEEENETHFRPAPVVPAPVFIPCLPCLPCLPWFIFFSLFHHGTSSTRKKRCATLPCGEVTAPPVPAMGVGCVVQRSKSYELCTK